MKSFRSCSSETEPSTRQSKGRTSTKKKWKFIFVKRVLIKMNAKSIARSDRHYFFNVNSDSASL